MPKRIEKVNELLSQELAKLLNEEFAEDYGIITINYLDTTPDLKNAKVIIGILNKNKEEIILQKLQKRSEYLRRVIGRRIFLRDVPHFTFESDTGAEKVMKVEALLDQINKEK